MFFSVLEGGVQEGVFFSVFFRGVVQTRPKPLLLRSVQKAQNVTFKHAYIQPHGLFNN